MNDKKEKKHLGKKRKKELEKQILADPSSLSDLQLLELVLSYGMGTDEYIDMAREVYDKTVEKKCLFNSDAMFLSFAKKDKKAMSFFKVLKEIDAKNTLENENIVFNDFDDAGEFFRKNIGDEACETFFVAFLSENGRVLKIEKMNEGSIDGVGVDCCSIANRALALDTKSMVVAHNHPSGVLTPSMNDLCVTENLKKHVEKVGLCLKEHYIVTSRGYIGLLGRYSKEDLK